MSYDESGQELVLHEGSEPRGNKIIGYDITYGYEDLNGTHWEDMITLDRDAVEREGNERQGITSSLEPGWVNMRDDEFRDVALMSAMRLFDNPLAIDDEGFPVKEMDEFYSFPILLLPASAITFVEIAPVYDPEEE